VTLGYGAEDSKDSAWKEHDEHRLDAFLRAKPQASTRDVEQTVGFSPGKTVGMRAWKRHQARKDAAEPRHVKERRLSKIMLACRPDKAAVDPTTAVEQEDQVLQVIREAADPDTRGAHK
jgi:hypothetical protein